MMGSVDLSHIKAIKADFTQAPIALWRIHALISKNVNYQPNSQAQEKNHITRSKLELIEVSEKRLMAGKIKARFR